MFLKGFSFNHRDAFHGKVLKYWVTSHESNLVSEEFTKKKPNIRRNCRFISSVPHRKSPKIQSLVVSGTSLSSFSLHWAQPFSVDLTSDLLLTASPIDSLVWSLFLNLLSVFYLFIPSFPSPTSFMFFKALVWLIFQDSHPSNSALLFAWPFLLRPIAISQLLIRPSTLSPWTLFSLYHHLPLMLVSPSPCCST